MPRNQDHPGNCSAALGTAIILSFLSLDNNFSPFDKREPSIEHYNSNPEFLKLPFRTWEVYARKLIDHARLLIPNDPHYQKIRESNQEGGTSLKIRESNRRKDTFASVHAPEPMSSNRATPSKNQASSGRSPSQPI